MINTSKHKDEPLKSALDLKLIVWCAADPLHFGMANVMIIEGTS